MGGETHRFVLPEIDIDIRELLPCYKLAWCAVDCLTRQLERPFILALTAEEIALCVEQEIRLWCLPHSCAQYLYCLDFLI
jgi:hypothetical protein